MKELDFEYQQKFVQEAVELFRVRSFECHKLA